MASLALNTGGTLAQRQLVFIDRNRDMYILGVLKRGCAKLASMVDAMAWHSSTNMLAAMADLKLSVW